MFALEKVGTVKLVLLLGLVGLFFYANSLLNGFVWDDEEEIVNNQIIQNWQNLPSIVSGGTFNTGGAGSLSGWFFRPGRTLTLMVNYSLWGPNATGWHLVQIIFHLVNGLLLFLILLKLLEKSSFPKTLAFTFSLLFVVHPAINEAVVYIAAASEVMFTFVNLTAFYLIVRERNNSPTWPRILFFALLLMMGLLIKESAVVIFPIIALYLWLFKVKSWSRWLVPAGAVLGLYFILRLLIVHTPIRPLQLSMIGEASLAERLMTVPYIVFGYLKIIFYPAYLAISQQHITRAFNFNDFFLPLAGVALFLTVFLLAAYRDRTRVALFGLLWFALALTPILNIFPLDMTIGERWLYFPLVGLMIGAAGWLGGMERQNRRLRWLTIFLLAVVPLLGLRTMVRNTNWYDGYSLYHHDLRINPESFDLENNLGVELFRRGQVDEARPHFEKAYQLNPKWYFALNNLGAIYQRQGNFRKASEYYQKTLEASDYYLAYENLAYVKLKSEKPEATLEFLKTALGKLPYNSKLWLAQALAYYQLEKYSEAEASAKQAYLLAPSAENQLFYQMIIRREKIPF